MQSTPQVWVLLGKGQGGNAQMITLAEALGWPFETRQLYHNAWNRLPNLLLGPSVISVDRRRSDPLRPPWPDLVIAASRRSAPVARWIKRQSSGKARLVHLFHAQAPLQRFDLVITLPQYRLSQHPNVLHLAGALNRIPAHKLEAAAGEWQVKFQDLPRPHIALIVGGNSSTYEMDPATAARLGREASAAARSAGGSLLISTTPRTTIEAAEALFATIDVPAYRYRWQPHDGGNPYFAFLALADRFIVTVDSASVPVEACATGKPVAVFEWPRRPSPSDWVSRWMELPPLRQIYQALIYWGLIKPARDFDAYHRILRDQGLVTRLGEPDRERRVEREDGLGLAVARIRELLGYPAAGSGTQAGANGSGGTHGVSTTSR